MAYEPPKRRNRIRCKRCNDVIESKHVHDFVTCKCGSVSVDGGNEYHKRCFVKVAADDYEEMP